MRELFIYYRVDSRTAPRLHEVVAQWQAQLRATHPGLVARLLVRGDEPGNGQTWMETYSTRPELLPLGIDATLQAQIAREAEQLLAPLLDGPRHVEVFHACAS